MGNNLSLVKKGEIVSWYLETTEDGYNLHGRLGKKNQKKEEQLDEVLLKNQLFGNVGGSRCKKDCFYFEKVEEMESGEVFITFKNGKFLNYSRFYDGWTPLFRLADKITLIDLALVQLTDPQSRIILGKVKRAHEEELERKREEARRRRQQAGGQQSENMSTIQLGGNTLKFGDGKIENPETGRMVSIEGKKGTEIIMKGGLCLDKLFKGK